MSKTVIRPVSRKSDLVTQELKKEVLIYDLTIDKAFSLNETSSLIWNLCNGQNSVSEIAVNLSQRFGSSVNEDVVWLALEQLKKAKLLANGEEISVDFSGLSRRDLIRKIGFASLITLPMISSLVAPIPINAASSTCTSGTQCPAPISCCSNISGQPRTCVTTRTSTGNPCGLSCECVGSCCVNNVCASSTVTAGNPCSNSCQYRNGTSCNVSGICA